MNCKLKKSCQECNKSHNTFLHDNPPTVNKEESDQRPVVVLTNRQTVSRKYDKTLLCIVPVSVWSDDVRRSVSMSALLDTGSTTSLCTKQLSID